MKKLFLADPGSFENESFYWLMLQIALRSTLKVLQSATGF